MSNVEHPAHYNAGKFEVIEVIRDWGLNFSLGNVVKYIARAEHKGRLAEDLAKAAWYLQYEIEKVRGLKGIGVPRSVLMRLAKRHELREIVREEGDVYLERYYLHGTNPVSNAEVPDEPFKVFLHRFRRSDSDRELHNHPWPGFSLILAGGYTEERRAGERGVTTRTLLPGDTNVLGPDTFHRVDLIDEDCWTLFVTGPRQQSWGFWDRDTGEFVNWRDRLRARGIEPSY